mgnify:CR=1 FL=1
MGRNSRVSSSQFLSQALNRSNIRTEKISKCCLDGRARITSKTKCSKLIGRTWIWIKNDSCTASKANCSASHSQWTTIRNSCGAKRNCWRTLQRDNTMPIIVINNIAASTAPDLVQKVCILVTLKKYKRDSLKKFVHDKQVRLDFIIFFVIVVDTVRTLMLLLKR